MSKREAAASATERRAAGRFAAQVVGDDSDDEAPRSKKHKKQKGKRAERAEEGEGEGEGGDEDDTDSLARGITRKKRKVVKSKKLRVAVPLVHKGKSAAKVAAPASAASGKARIKAPAISNAAEASSSSSSSSSDASDDESGDSSDDSEGSVPAAGDSGADEGPVQPPEATVRRKFVWTSDTATAFLTALADLKLIFIDEPTIRARRRDGDEEARKWGILKTVWGFGTGTAGGRTFSFETGAYNYFRSKGHSMRRLVKSWTKRHWAERLQSLRVSA